VIDGHAIRAFALTETVMRHVTYIVAIGTIAAAVAGCADPYAPRSGYSQGYNYNYPSGYSYPATSSYPSGSDYYPTRYGYGSNGDYNRNYGGTRSSPQVTFTFP
jgi:hypothetical protein